MARQEKEVADKITKALNEIKEHTFVDKSDITLRELMEEIINYKHSTGLVTDSTFYRNKETIKQIEKKSCANFWIYLYKRFLTKT